MEFIPEQTIFDEIIEFLALRPTSEQVLAFKPSAVLDARLQDLMDKNTDGNITPDEKSELLEFLRLNHFLKMLKLKIRLQSTGQS